MRTNIDIDDALLTDAMAATGLRTLVGLRGRVEALEHLAGLGWAGDLEAMRASRLPDRA